MTTTRVIVAMCVAFIIMTAFHFGAPYVESFAAAQGWLHEGPGEVVIVEDSLARAPAIGSVVASPEVRDAAAKKAFTFRVADPASTSPDVAEVSWAIDASKGKTLPVICSRHGSGRATVKPLPATPKDCVQYIQAL